MQYCSMQLCDTVGLAKGAVQNVIQLALPKGAVQNALSTVDPTSTIRGPCTTRMHSRNHAFNFPTA